MKLEEKRMNRMKIQAPNGIMYADIIEDALNQSELLALKDRMQEQKEMKIVRLGHLIIATAMIVHKEHLIMMRGINGFGDKIVYKENLLESKSKRN